MIKQTILILIVVCFMVPLVMAAEDTTDDSMDVDDIKNTKASIPFGGGFFGMVIAATKWAAFFGFLIGLTMILCKGPIASAMNNANMKHEAQDGLFGIAKILILGAAVYLCGCYIFETFF